MFEMARNDACEEVQSDDEFLLLDLALHNAGRGLLTTPSPHLAALTYKLEAFRDQEIYHIRSDRVCEILEVLIADARRLSGERAS